MSGTKDKKPQGESKTPAPPVEEEVKATCVVIGGNKLSLQEVAEALGTIEEATVAFKVAEKRKTVAAELASEAEELAKVEESKIRSADAKAKYLEAQATILKNERIVEEERWQKDLRESKALVKAEAEEADRLAAEETAKVEAEASTKARRDAGEYEPMVGEQVGEVFLSKSALDIGGVGVILRIVPLDNPGGKAVGLPEHLFIPLVKPSNGILRRSTS